MRVTLFILGIFIALNAPIWIFLPYALVYALIFRAYELIILGVFIDAIFGIHMVWFGAIYTVSLGALVLFCEVLKPHISFYNAK